MTKRALCFLLLLVAPSVVATQQRGVSVLVPQNMARVPWRACLIGTGYEAGLNLIAAVHPADWSDVFIQPAISRDDSGKFEVVLYIGESTPHIYEGQIFEVRLFNDTNHKYREGMRLSAFPTDAVAVTPLIRVVRKDDAQSGCDESALPPSARDVAGVNALQGRSPGSAAPAGRAPPLHTGSEFLRTCLLCLSALALITFIALTRVTKRAETAADRISRWIEPFRIWLVNVAVKLVESVRSLWEWLFAQLVQNVRVIWDARGYEGSLRHFALVALAFPVFVGASVVAFYADARTNLISVGLIFGVESDVTTGIAVVPFLTGETTTGSQPSSNPVSAAELGSRPSNIILRLADRMIRSFEELWEENLGFFAMGIACLQGAFGLCLLWGMKAWEAVRLRPFALLRQRPLVSACFFGLNFAVTLLAANRGYELSHVGTNWFVPAVISGTLSLALPLIMAFTLHAAIECAADCMAVVELGLLVFGAALLALMTISVWVFVSLMTVASAAIAFGVFCILVSIAWMYLQTASLIGEFVRDIRSGSDNLGMGIPARAISALIGTIILTGGGYFIIRGLVQ